MKKLAFIVMTLVSTGAFANDFYYAEYASPDAEYGEPETAVVATPVNAVRDNYVGIRLHKMNALRMGLICVTVWTQH